MAGHRNCSFFNSTYQLGEAPTSDGSPDLLSLLLGINVCSTAAQDIPGTVESICHDRWPFTVAGVVPCSRIELVGSCERACQRGDASTSESSPPLLSLHLLGIICDVAARDIYGTVESISNDSRPLLIAGVVPCLGIEVAGSCNGAC